MRVRGGVLLLLLVGCEREPLSSESVVTTSDAAVHDHTTASQITPDCFLAGVDTCTDASPVSDMVCLGSCRDLR